MGDFQRVVEGIDEDINDTEAFMLRFCLKGETYDELGEGLKTAVFELRLVGAFSADLLIDRGLMGEIKHPEGTIYITTPKGKESLRKYEENHGKAVPWNRSKAFESRVEHIVKLSNGKYRLVSKKTGRNLGTYDSHAGAEKRERQVQYFKHKGG